MYLNKTDYLSMNKKSFSNLNKQQKDAKYDAYLSRKSSQAKGKQVNSKTSSKTVKAVPKQRNRQPRPKLTKSPISECTLLYAQASVDPFQKLQGDPCIPDALCTPSYKFNAMAKGTAVVGTDGTAVILYNPFAMVINDNGKNDDEIDYPILASTSAYDSEDVVYSPGDVPTKLLGVNSNSFFTTAVMRPVTAGKSTPTYRLVAGGVELFYTGQLLNQSGTITVLQNDGLATFESLATVSQIQNNPRAVTCATSKDSRCYVSYYPTNADVLSYKTIDNYRASGIGGGMTLYAPLIILVAGATPGTTFAFEAKAYFECLIPGMSATPSESDPIGYPAFQAARTNVLPSNDPQADLRATLQGTLRNIGSSISGLAPTVGTAIGAVFGNPAAGGMIGTAAKTLLNSLLSGNGSSLGSTN